MQSTESIRAVVAPASPRPTHAADSALRLTVTGAAGRLDVAAPLGTDVASLAAEYAERLGLDRAPALTTAAGQSLDPGARLEQVLDHGELVVAHPTERGVSRSGGASPVTTQAVQTQEERGLFRATSTVLVLAGGCAVIAAALVAASSTLGSGSEVVPGSSWARLASAAVLMSGALLVAVPRPGSGSSRSWSFLAGPALGAAGGFAAVWVPTRGGVLLSVTVAGIAAVALAAVARTGLDGEREDLARVWLLAGGVATVGSVLALVVGASPLALASVLFAAAVMVTRLLPSLVVDVPDDVLLDLDRLAVTAWSAREPPRGGRRRHQVRSPMVREVAHHSRRTVAAGVVVTCFTAAVTGPVMVLAGGGEPTRWAHWAGLAMVVLGAASLALVGRTNRSLLPRLLLGLTAGWLVALTVTVVAVDLEASGRWYVFVAVAVLAPAVVLAAVSLGAGWRSVWWARVGEVLETLSGVFVLALLPLASGLFDLVRSAVG